MYHGLTGRFIPRVRVQPDGSGRETTRRPGGSWDASRGRPPVLVAGWWFGDLLPKNKGVRTFQGSPDVTRRGLIAEHPCSRGSKAPAVIDNVLLPLLKMRINYVNIA